MNNLYMDLETIPSQREGTMEAVRASVKPPANMTKEETIQRWYEEKGEDAVENAYRRLALSGNTGEIIAMAWAIDDEEPQVLYRQPNESEGQMLSTFAEDLNAIKFAQSGKPASFCWVGHNILGFDLRFLRKRLMIHGVKHGFEVPALRRPYDVQVYDTMLEWGCYDRQDMVALPTLMNILGIENDADDISGAEVWDYVKAGHVEEVARHAVEDVRRTRRVYKRMNYEE